MNIEELREYCLTKKGVEETLPFGVDTLVYKVMGKVFLLTGLNGTPLSFNVKCDPEKAESLREEFTAVKPGYHMNKKHWNTITADGSVPDRFLYEQVDHSYDLVVEKLSTRIKDQLLKKKGKKE
jgi:predicted DNA-binding protein (MmcQ/YjbR family)